MEELLGQLFMVGFHGSTLSTEMAELIQQQRVGGVILFERNIQSAQQVSELTHSLQMCARAAGHPAPLLIALDQENGMVRRLGEHITSLPGNMALGAIASEEVAYEVALATGRELRALGLTMNLAPVIDVNNNPANPVIGTRSFGEEPSLVARLGAAQVRGYRDAGIIATLKHFPGHGDTTVDSHYALPVIPHTLERLQAIELLPFQRGIEEGAECIMTAHIAFPALTHDMTPATLSSDVLQGLLRTSLGYQGVIISDCMEMKAISATVGVERASVQALHSGVDIVLISHRHDRQHAAFAAVEDAVQQGELSLARVHAAIQRVLALKNRYLSWETLPLSTAFADLDLSAHQHLRDTAYARSTTLVKDAFGLLPLKLDADQRILVLYSGAYAGALVHMMRRYHPNTQAFAVPQQLSLHQIGDILHMVGDADIVLVATVNAYRDKVQSELVTGLVHLKRCPVIGLALASPYDLLAYPELSTYLVIYEYTRPAIKAVLRVLFGEAQAQGHLPVSL